ncbi:MAG TPA: D-2-hydroxyacid dehydrogenase [Candidatus Acidoferrales bacterium]|nr:D-2-hydroxyacid dehydrogenase [Candidatus Acidoferrales bacterium]
MTEIARTQPSDTKLVICVHHPFTFWNPPPEMAERVRRRWPGMCVVHLPTYDRLADELTDTDIFVGYSLLAEQFITARKLKWIHVTAAAVAHLMYPGIRSSGIVMTNASGIHSIPMAEHIIGTFVALARRFPDCVRYQMQSDWCQQRLWDAPPELRPTELRGRTALFIGFGAVGREAGKLARAIGMRVWAVTRSGKSEERIAERVFPATALHDALPQADFVVVAAPETSETTNMMDDREFSLLKPSAYFINVARGALVDEPALIRALEQRKIAGAALDVTAEEPLPSESPLWGLENAFITPHSSAISDRLWERQTDLLMENLERWFSGRELVNRVDFVRGY